MMAKRMCFCFILLTMLLCGCGVSREYAYTNITSSQVLLDSSSDIENHESTEQQDGMTDVNTTPVYTQMNQMVTMLPTGLFPNHTIQNSDKLIQFSENGTSIFIRNMKGDIIANIGYSQIINDQLSETSMSFNMITLESTIYFYQDEQYVYLFLEGTGGSDVPCIAVLRLDLAVYDFDQCLVYPNTTLLTAAADDKTFYVMGLTNPMAAAYPATQSFISLLNRETLEEYQVYN